MGWLVVGACPRGNHKNTTNGAVARFFVTGGHYRECRRQEPFGGGGGGGGWGSGGILPKNSLKFGGSETLFSALVMKYVSEK